MTDAILPKTQSKNGSADAARVAGSGLRAFVTRLHFYVGLFVGPFILIAAITGTLYVLTPQIENMIYRDQLRTSSLGTVQPLAEQVKAARDFIGEEPKLFAIRPSTGPGWNSRVMFNEPGLGESESRAIFVDPITLAIKGDLVVYGTSGVLPLRASIDYLHRNLMLGNFGRYYSELAASWLWVAALGGVLLWWWKRDIRRSSKAKENVHLRTRRLHSQIGIWIAVGLVFISATGMTWSQLAGGRIDDFRAAVGWITPSVSATLDKPAAAADPHAEHNDHGSHQDHSAVASTIDYVSQLDAVNLLSRQSGLDSPMLEIRLPRNADQAWLVREYDRSWPTQVDTIAIDPRDMKVISRADFETFPIIAKLIRWGIDLHMGVLFGVANQVVMALLGLSLIGMIIYGYRIWWQRRPPVGATPRTLIQSWLYLNAAQRVLIVVVAAAIGWALPMIGLSLIAFMLVDLARWRFSNTRAVKA
ncbi:PepSY-associated TM helix domain-containing protein [Brucella rhizosphaerae]|uniref:PepSY-associated TM helix family protein n=1 Tax=Brucella rhizosphaerae TaxID=571254 RepID=A0A256FL85_9HYPH|nr:PepSY-associated TM helix domain-containing protein [Brucella rhizosphaerae]OYR15579.1 pepSY-associated TM helix family protein [Brucella rhizosphaerae]